MTSHSSTATAHDLHADDASTLNLDPMTEALHLAHKFNLEPPPPPRLLTESADATPTTDDGESRPLSPASHEPVNPLMG